MGQEVILFGEERDKHRASIPSASCALLIFEGLPKFLPCFASASPGCVGVILAPFTVAISPISLLNGFRNPEWDRISEEANIDVKTTMITLRPMTKQGPS